MTSDSGEFQKIGSADVDGELVEFWWAKGYTFISAQFASREPRGIANVDRVDSESPVLVPLSQTHKAWLAEGNRADQVIEQGRIAYTRHLPRSSQLGKRRASQRRPRQRFSDHNTAPPDAVPVNRYPTRAVRTQ